MTYRLDRNRVPWTRTAGGLLAALTPFALIAATAAPKPAPPPTFLVRIGGETDGGAIQGLGFYPAIVTVAVGDRVEWQMNSGDPHTVLFPYGTTLPGRREIRGHTGALAFGGQGTASSGILSDGKTYTLTFTKPGTYLYESGVNPGMEGAVMVLPKRSPLPETPAQAFSQGNHEMEDDLNAALAAEAALRPVTAAGPGGTTVATVYADVPPPQSWLVPLGSATGPARGAAQITVENPSTVSVSLSVDGLAPKTSYTAAIRFGAPVASAPLVGKLGTLIADRLGAGATTAILKGIEGGVAGRVSFITVSAADGKTVAHGRINIPAFGVLGFLPAEVTIHAGDTVVWTQNDPHELETVTLAKPGQALPAYPGAAAETPAGGSVVTGPGFYNSGLLSGGESYRLTFQKPGVYPYVSLVHAASPVAMTGSVVVLPRTAR